MDLLILAMDDGWDTYRNNMGLRPLGPHKISWMARKHGYKSITISKLQLLSEDEIVELCMKFISKNTVIGISTTFMTLPELGAEYLLSKNSISFKNFVNAVEKLRVFDNEVLVGGSQADFFKPYFNNSTSIAGYAENAVVDFLDKKFRFGITKQIPKWDIKTCDFTWEKIDCIQPQEVITLETSRGCIFTCKFCGWEETGKRKGTFETSIDSIRKQLINNYEKFGTTHYLLANDTFNDDDERINEWCDMLETLPFKIKYSGFMRLDLMHRFQQTTRRMYETGLRGCHFGIESFHPAASKIIGKSFNGIKAKEFIPKLFHDIFEGNVAITTTNIVGLPHESIEYVYESFEWYKKNSYLHASFIPLFLTKDLKRYIKPSEFALNYEKYGYVFSTGSDVDWSNEHMDLYKASQVVSDIMSKLPKHESIDSWMAMLHMSYSGLDPKDYIHTKNFEQKNKNIEMIRQENMNYFEAIRNIKYES